MNNSRCEFYVNGLGTVSIYPDKGGYAVDINGERAWSACKGSLRSVELSVKQDIRTWKYISGFSR